MFILDMPPVPPQSAPLMIAQASQAQQSAAAAGRTVGVCHIVGNATGSLSPENLLEPALSAMTYFRLYEHRTEPQHAKVTVLQDPKHGLLKDEGNGIYSYLPSPGYLGKDKATVLVEIGGYKVKMVYFFQSITGSGSGNSTYETLCGKRGEFWRISRASEVPDEQPNIDLLAQEASNFGLRLSSPQYGVFIWRCREHGHVWRSLGRFIRHFCWHRHLRPNYPRHHRRRPRLVHRFDACG